MLPRILFVLLVIVCSMMALASLTRASEHPTRAMRPSSTDWPPAYFVRTAYRIGRCEQPSATRNGKWTTFQGIAWHQTHNYSFPGGLGYTQLLWTTFKRKGQPRLMSSASPKEQVWAAWRGYKHFVRLLGQGGAATLWDCSHIIGFYGFNPDGTWR